MAVLQLGLAAGHNRQRLHKLADHQHHMDHSHQHLLHRTLAVRHKVPLRLVGNHHSRLAVGMLHHSPGMQVLLLLGGSQGSLHRQAGAEHTEGHHHTGKVRHSQVQHQVQDHEVLLELHHQKS